MRSKTSGAGLLAMLLLSACGGATSSPTPSASPLPSPCASPADLADQSQDPAASESSACGGTAGPGGGGGGGGPGAGGGGVDGSITRTWSESVTQTGDGFSSVVTQQYTAVVQVNLTKVDVGGWEITGPATVTSSFTSDVTKRLATLLGAPCDVHYTDDASGAGTVTVTGGLEAIDGFYQFFVDIPGVDGSNATVRDDSACDGPNDHETTLWQVAPMTAGGSGDFTDPGQISGSSSAPRPGGEDTVTWSFTLPD
jgi:hypothetical protein